MRQKRRPCRPVLLLCLSAVLGVAPAGCAGKMREGLVPVAGKVFNKGKPLTRGSVEFIPDRVMGNTNIPQPRGDIDAQGNYQLVTGEDRSGAPPGHYIVTVTAPGIAPRYGQLTTSPLKVGVRADAPPGSYNLKLE